MHPARNVAAAGARIASRIQLLGALERQAGSVHALRVLMYHRVADPASTPGLHPGLVSATPAAFAEQMAFLAERYRVVSADDVLRAHRSGQPIGSRAVLITFDDAYADFVDHAWPILRKHGLPALMFVPTGFPDRPRRSFWWDRLHVALENAEVDAVDTPAGRLPLRSEQERVASFKRLRTLVKSLPHAEGMDLIESLCCGFEEGAQVGPVLDWEALRKLAAEGITLAPHTECHPMLDRLPIAEARREVRTSIADLTRIIGASPPLFAYPAGQFNRETRDLLAEEGIELAFTTRRGLADLRRDDPLTLPRIPVNQGCTQELLRAQLLPALWKVLRR